MSIRTTALAVQKILRTGPGGDYDGRADLTPYIETASAMTDRIVACATTKGNPLTATEAELIERWLSAHFYAVSDKPYAEKATEGARAVFQGKTGMRLEFTGYGQTAISLDPSGCTEQMNKRVTVGGFWLGRRPSEQTDYTDRD